MLDYIQTSLSESSRLITQRQEVVPDNKPLKSTMLLASEAHANMPCLPGAEPCRYRYAPQQWTEEACFHTFSTSLWTLSVTAKTKGFKCIIIIDPLATSCGDFGQIMRGVAPTLQEENIVDQLILKIWWVQESHTVDDMRDARILQNVSALCDSITTNEEPIGHFRTMSFKITEFFSPCLQLCGWAIFSLQSAQIQSWDDCRTQPARINIWQRR